MPTDLDALLTRPGLDPVVRCLVCAKAAIWPADWARFVAAVDRARTLGAARADVEEVLLQATLFYGFPRVVSAFEHLARAWPTAVAPTGGGLPPAEHSRAGRTLFASIYGRNDAAVRSLLASFHGEFHDFVLEAAYGRILARPGLSARTRELLAVGALAALRQEPQLIAHGRGAMSFGASRDEVREAVVTATGTTDAADVAMQRI